MAGDLSEPVFRGGRVLQLPSLRLTSPFTTWWARSWVCPSMNSLGAGSANRVPLFATVSAQTGPEMMTEAKTLAAQGWRAIRFMFVDPDPAQEEVERLFEPRDHLAATAEWLNRSREELGHDLVLGIDWHHRLSVAEAASFCEMLAPHALDFLEEPIRDEIPSAYEALRRMTRVPFAIGEEFAEQVAVSPLHRTRHSQRRSARRVQRGWPHRSDEGCRLGGGSLHGSHASQPSWANMLSRLGTPAAAVANFTWLEFSEAIPEEIGQFYDREIYPVQPEWVLVSCFCRTSLGLALRSKSQSLARHFVSTSSLICGATMAP